MFGDIILYRLIGEASFTFRKAPALFRSSVFNFGSLCFGSSRSIPDPISSSLRLSCPIITA